MEDVRLAFVSVPRDEAKKFARDLLENRLAACVNMIPKIESWFWWEDKIEYDEETLLMIKTTRQRFEDLRLWIIEHHPYDLPEIIALPISEGSPDYINWVIKELEQE